jgi:hypothetical protein
MALGHGAREDPAYSSHTREEVPPEVRKTAQNIRFSPPIPLLSVSPILHQGCSFCQASEVVKIFLLFLKKTLAFSEMMC